MISSTIVSDDSSQTLFQVENVEVHRQHFEDKVTKILEAVLDLIELLVHVLCPRVEFSQITRGIRQLMMQKCHSSKMRAEMVKLKLL